jgi:UDPglucose 6-dehydrogenase
MSKICVIGTGYESALVRAYDPQAMENAARVLNNVTLCETPYQVAENADAVILATEWNEFKQLDLLKLKASMEQPIILDGRNLWNSETLEKIGFVYIGIGRGDLKL